jgi:hypothetical protein
MSDKVIGDYSAALSIDGSTNYLLIQPGNSSTAYNKINRNTLLGVTGQPADITSSQTLQNKTIDNTNAATLKDGSFTLQNSSSTTKQAHFSVSGITAGQNRTITLPDYNASMASIAGTETLTNKTLTAPTINNGSITGSTITVDAIVGQSAGTSGTIFGLPVSSGAVGSNGVVTASITDGAVTPAKLQSGTGGSWAWQAYVPTWTNVTLGNGTSSGGYIQSGKTVFYYAYLLFGSTTSVTGSVSFSLPVTSVAVVGYGLTIGQATMTLNAATAPWQGPVIHGTTTTGIMRWYTVQSTGIVLTNIGASSPDSWATNTKFLAQGFYQAA